MPQAESRFETRFEAILPTLATKPDLADVRVDVADVRVDVANLRAEMSQQFAEQTKLIMNMMKWMVGLFVATLIAMAGLGLSFYRIALL